MKPRSLARLVQQHCPAPLGGLRVFQELGLRDSYSLVQARELTDCGCHQDDDECCFDDLIDSHLDLHGLVWRLMTELTELWNHRLPMRVGMLW